ncbi:MAG TPA: MarR family transcriptional regulator [Candidatus Aquilonibacter sp.]|nr:MarR family transcriptional regulator [Candidatus Aquilonibacter sp.]
MGDGREQCAREILETVPAVMRFIRDQVRRRGAAGLSLPQFRTLIFLGRVKNSSLSAVAEHLGLSLPAMSRLINGLVDHRLAQRQTVSTNRRQVALTLTVRGQAALEKARKEVRSQLADSIRFLPGSEQKTIQRAMQMLHKVFGSQPTIGTAIQKVKP